MDVQELVRLVGDGASDREITTLVGLNRRTVNRYRRWATDQHLLDGPLPNVGELLGRRRCADCQRFGRVLGVAAVCSECGEPVLLVDLFNLEVPQPA